MAACKFNPVFPKEMLVLQLLAFSHFTRLNQGNLSLASILEELTITIHNPGIINAWLYDLEREPSLTADLARLDLNVTSSLEKNLTVLFLVYYLCSHAKSLLECVDDLTEKQARYQAYQRSLSRQAAYLKRAIFNC